MKPAKHLMEKGVEVTKLERMKLYSKQLAEKQNSKQGKNPPKTPKNLDCVLNRLPLVGDKDNAIDNGSASTRHPTINEHSHNTEQRAFRFTAQPGGVLHLTKASATGVGEASGSRPLKTNVRRNRYAVPSRIDTGLVKRYARKVLVISKRTHLQHLAMVVKESSLPAATNDAGVVTNVKPVGSGFLFNTAGPFPSAKPMTPVTYKMKVSKRKQSVDLATRIGSSDVLRQRMSSTPRAQVSKRQRLISKSEKRLQVELTQLITWGKEIQNYTKEVAAFNLEDNLEDKPRHDEDDEVFDCSFPICSTLKVPRIKCVTFKIPPGLDETPISFTGSPRLRLSTSELLGDGGKLSTCRTRHDMGNGHSDVRPKTPSIKLSPLMGLIAKSSTSSPQATGIEPSEDEAVQQLELLKTIMSDFKDSHVAEGYLADIESFFPKFMWRNKSIYWEVKALIAEKRGAVKAANDIFQLASSKVPEEEAQKLEDAMSSFRDSTSTVKATELMKSVSSLRRKRSQRQSDEILKIYPRLIKFNTASAKKLTPAKSITSGET